MLIKTEAILLRKTPYADNSAIMQIFTQTHGLQSFIAQGLHGKSGKAALLQPGNLLQIVFYYQANKNLKRIKEIQLMTDFYGYPQDPVRLQVLIFCLELVQKCIPDEQQDPHAFEFLKTCFLNLSKTDAFKWFPLQFLFGFATQCGLGLQLHTNIKNGDLTLEFPHHNTIPTGMNPMQILNKDELLACRQLETGEIPDLDIAARRQLTEKLIHYFKIHLFPEKELRSYKILLEVLGD